ncbi:hypothetical protein K438DRAFT_1807687 [Mycena galopus ATCC 62051]|nr:hypothetical protein K438DRAFT_1807687 [Mycena galopus ATCC 62051]
MSQTANPDTRQLPPGWITQFDGNYNAWFYVNTQVQPPVTTWVHPLGATPSPGAYGAPQGSEKDYFPTPQPTGSPYPAAAANPYPPQQGGGYDSGSGYPQAPQPGQYSPQYSPQPPPQQYPNPPPQEDKGLLSGLFGGSSQQQPVYGQGQPMYGQGQPMYAMSEPPPKKHGIGMGTVALGAGSLLGGVLLAEAFEGHGHHNNHHHHHHNRW